MLKIASTSEVAKTQAATYVGEITEFTRLSPSTVSFAIEIPNRDELVFLPGQYVNIAVPGTDESRSYSFSNAPDDKSLTFLVKLTPGGVMSTYLDERAKVGDQLTFTGPNGSFFLREGQGPALLLAGGTGLAPILSILRKMRSGGSRPMHLIYGVNTDDDAVELEHAGEPRHRTGQPDLGLLRRGQGQLGGAQGLRHRPHRARASLRRRRRPFTCAARRRWSRRSASTSMSPVWSRSASTTRGSRCPAPVPPLLAPRRPPNPKYRP